MNQRDYVLYALLKRLEKTGIRFLAPGDVVISSADVIQYLDDPQYLGPRIVSARCRPPARA